VFKCSKCWNVFLVSPLFCFSEGFHLAIRCGAPLDDGFHSLIPSFIKQNCIFLSGNYLIVARIIKKTCTTIMNKNPTLTLNIIFRVIWKVKVKFYVCRRESGTQRVSCYKFGKSMDGNYLKVYERGLYLNNTPTIFLWDHFRFMASLYVWDIRRSSICGWNCCRDES
jgi:hypothetical protein